MRSLLSLKKTTDLWRLLLLLSLLGFLTLTYHSFWRAKHPFSQPTFSSPERYLSFNTLSAGFNNQCHEILLYVYLAYCTNRRYVYHPFAASAWQESDQPFERVLNMQALSSHLISTKDFDARCQGRTVTIRVDKWPMHNRLDAFFDTLREHVNEPCLHVDTWVLDWDYAETTDLIQYWPHYRDVVLRQFQWSALVRKAAEDIVAKFKKHGVTDFVSVHVRRGDYVNHCKFLFSANKPFIYWNHLPSKQKEGVQPVSQNITDFLRHCLPSPEDITIRIESLIKANAHWLSSTRGLHVMHTGGSSIVSHLKQHFGKQFAFYIDSDELAPSDLNVMTDMEVARRSAIFIGNGWSTTTSQVVQLRVVDDKSTGAYAFW